MSLYRIDPSAEGLAGKAAAAGIVPIWRLLFSALSFGQFGELCDESRFGNLLTVEVIPAIDDSCRRMTVASTLIRVFDLAVHMVHATTLRWAHCAQRIGKGGVSSELVCYSM
jgi:hypothetical protein